MKKIVVVGSLNMDFVVNVQEMPLKGETVFSKDFSRIPGGKGSNQAFVLGKLGGNVTMLGAVGKDDTGLALLGNLEKSGVDVSRIKLCDRESTGIAFITVNEAGQNSIIVNQGANKTVDIPYIDSNMDLLESCDIVLFQLEIPLETVIYTAKKAKAMGKTVILDPAPARANLPRELYECVDFIKPNEVEITTLLEDPQAQEHLEAAASSLQGLGVKNVVVTLGGQGAFLQDSQGNATHFLADNSLTVVDTTAAGDSFTAAMAYGLSRGSTIPEAVELAIRVSNIVVTRKGAQSSIPTLEEVEQYSLQRKSG